MIKFNTLILKFDEQGEKTGWTYIVIPAELALKLKPNNKKSFRVKGKLDTHAIKQVALVPMGEGDFIMPLNAEMRKALGKRKGAQLQVQLTADESDFVFCKEMMECLEDEPKALENFKKLSGSEQKYFSKWVDSAKTTETKAKRILQTLTAMQHGWRYGQMIRALKKES
ncbi:MAG: DUF1905 domain-containing protein [Chitinophagales bacterium]|nr:DUF1905 domain-containing protein [Chitinophagales bacterium]